MLIIGSGAWGQKVNRVLNRFNNGITIIGARKFISIEDKIKSEIIDSADLVWICTNSDLQLIILKFLLSFPQTKVIIEKPVCMDKSINKTLEDIFCKKQNLFISRPWNFSPVWINFKNQLDQTGKIDKITVKHYGESFREYCNPPQDWLHHDLCLIQELGVGIKFENFTKSWSVDFRNLSLQSKKNIQFDIRGGFKLNRESSFIVEYTDNTKFNLNLNQGGYSIEKSSEVEKFEKKDNSISINNMLNHFTEVQVSKETHDIELKYMQTLQLLATS